MMPELFESIGRVFATPATLVTFRVLYGVLVAIGFVFAPLALIADLARSRQAVRPGR